MRDRNIFRATPPKTNFYFLSLLWISICTLIVPCQIALWLLAGKNRAQTVLAHESEGLGHQDSLLINYNFC